MSSYVRVRAGALEWRKVGEEVVALDLRTQTYLAINKTGAEILPALVSGASCKDLVNQIRTTFDVSEKQAAADLDIFLAQLREQDLLDCAETR